MSLHRHARNWAESASIFAGHLSVSGGKSQVSRPGRNAFRALAALMALVYSTCWAQGVPTPPAPPPVPTDYCGSLYTELNGDLQAFNAQLASPPTWTPIPGGPTVYGATLQWANSNTGPQISNPAYFPTVQAEMQNLQALGVQAVSIPALFPILYEPFYGSDAAYEPYLTFYVAVANAAHAAGLKVIVDSEITFSNDIQAGWTNMNAFYSSLTWPEYMAAKAQMAATIAQNLQPDYLVLAEEPDTEAAQSGQTNLNIPADAAQMVAGEIAAVQALNMPNPPLMGAGFGSWMAASGTSSLLNYINAYIALPLDYIDFHLLPINTVSADDFAANALTISSMAAAVGKPVAISQAWLSKVGASEWDGYATASLDVERARQPFSFWAPLDSYFLQTAQTLAEYTNMLYLDLEQSYYLNAYQTYGGTVANGGSLNCTCTTASCSDYVIMQDENPLAEAADQTSVYTPTAFSLYNQLVTTPDTTPPTVPSNFLGTAGYTTVNLTWDSSTDNIAVAGYNVYRCSPPAAGQPCTGVWLATTTLPGYGDSSLAGGTLYNYQVQAFDFANNNSPFSSTVSVQTYITSPSSPTGLTATVVSSQEIDLSWSPPPTTTGLSQYLILAGTSLSNLVQIAVRPSTQTTYKDLNLAAGTTYYFGIVAVEQDIDAPMSPPAYATTLPLPNPPSNVAGVPSPTKIVLTWQENLQATSLPISYYQVFEGTTPGNMVDVGSVTSATYTATPLTAGTTYYFEIVAVDTGHDASAPSVQIAVTTLPMPAAPVDVVATANSTTQVTVTWTEIIPPGGLPITSYTIFRGTSPTTLVQVATRTASPFVDTTVSGSTTYYYTIQASDSGHDVSPASAPAQVTTDGGPAAPVNVAAVANSTTQVTVTWSETIPPGGLPISTYNIFRGTSPTGLTSLATRTASPFVDNTASPNTTYYYGVEATDTGHDVSPMSAIAQVTTDGGPAAPVNVAATANSTTQVTVTWSETIPPGGLPISTYNIFRGTSPTALTALATRTASPFVDNTASPNTTYYYGVKATDTGHDVSPMSATADAITFALPAVPSSVTATPNAATKVTITWSESALPNTLPISSYNILRGTSPSTLVKVGAQTTTKYVDTGVSATTTYYYAVEAVDTGHDTSPMSPTSQVATPAMPAAPVDVSPTANAATKVTVTWSGVVPPSGLPIQSYNIFRGTSPAALTKLASAPTTQFVDAAASPQSTYYYATETVDTGGDISPMSAIAQVVTPPLPAAPVNVVATANTATQVTVTWSENIPPNGLPIQQYNIFRGTSPGSLVEVASRTSSPFIDNAATSGTTYYYAIEAADTGHDTSPMSATAQVTTP
jgi:fibronectin type 3 domain-containing protein